MVELTHTNEAIWCRAFLSGEDFYCWLNVLTNYSFIPIFSFLQFCVLWFSFVFLGICQFHLGHPICLWTVVHCTLIILFISVELIVMSSVLFLILIICIFFLFFLSNLAKIYQFYWSFWRTNLWFCWLSLIFFYSQSLIFIIPFLLLALSSVYCFYI